MTAAGPAELPGTLQCVLNDSFSAFDSSAFVTTFLSSEVTLQEWLMPRIGNSSSTLSTEEILCTMLVFLLAIHLPTPIEPPPTSYLIRLTAGHALAYGVSELVSVWEKRGQYRAAIMILLLLLRLPYLPHRRGKWYIRLCIDLTHLCLRSLSAEFASQSLQDPLLQVLVLFNLVVFSAAHRVYVVV